METALDFFHHCDLLATEFNYMNISFTEIVETLLDELTDEIIYDLIDSIDVNEIIDLLITFEPRSCCGNHIRRDILFLFILNEKLKLGALHLN
jgi:hypothetical protein